MIFNAGLAGSQRLKMWSWLNPWPETSESRCSTAGVTSHKATEERSEQRASIVIMVV